MPGKISAEQINTAQTLRGEQAGAPVRRRYRTAQAGGFLLLLLLSGGLYCLADPPAKQKSSEKAAGKEQPPEAFSKPYGWHLQAILELVQATPEQKTAITSVVEQFRPKIDPLRQSYKEKRNQFLTAITTGVPADEIMVRQTDLSQLYSDISCQYCRMSLEIRKQLKPEQIVLYEQYRMKQGWNRPR